MHIFSLLASAKKDRYAEKSIMPACKDEQGYFLEIFCDSIKVIKGEMMSKLKNALLVGVSAATLGSTFFAATNFASAQSSTGDTLIDKLVAKFNLNKDDVQAVFDEEKTERQAERKAEISDRLQDAVDDGDITSDQKTLIENKISELQTTRDAERDALDAWAEQNGIDAKYVMGGGRGMRGGDNDRLQDAVDDGDITAEQKTLIESKLDELETAREAQRDELEQWAEDNGIDAKYLIGGGMGMMGGGRGPGGPGGF